ncbi:hypothetical protein Hanom_Chr15g01360461 [Helianthus anomalus]
MGVVALSFLRFGLFMSLQKHARSFNLLKPYSFKHKYHFYMIVFFIYFESY